MPPKLRFPAISRDNKLSEMIGLISLRSIVASTLLLLILYVFFSGLMTQFYASIVFGFYAVTNKMWVSVILLGVFQTILLIPLRIIRVRRGQNIQEFQDETKELEHSILQQKKLKQQFNFGNSTFLFYLVDFMIQLTSFLSIGRLFLKDFYSIPLNPNWLYSFVPYPEYPIQDRIFQLPYFVVSKTHDFGILGVLVLLALFSAVMIGIELFRRWKKSSDQSNHTPLSQLPARYVVTYGLMILVVSWVLAHHFPTGFEFKIFTGDVAVPNIKLNTVTAIVTFLTLLWFGYKRIGRVSDLARQAGVSSGVIERTERRLFSDSVKTSSFVGLGAYFITNHIPSAFELSVFTLEVISLASPLTLDKLVLRLGKKPVQAEEAIVVDQPAT